MTFIESYYQQCTKGFSYYKNHYAKVTIISSQNKSFLAHNWILLTSPTARYKIILLYFTTFSSNKNLFLLALRASRNKFNYDSCKTFILAFDYYHLRIIIISSLFPFQLQWFGLNSLWVQIFQEWKIGKKNCDLKQRV